MTDTVPPGLADLVRHGDLPEVALAAAADHRALHPALARRQQLPDDVFLRLYQPGLLPPVEDAVLLVRRHLPTHLVSHVLRTAGEDRHEILCHLLERNVPTDADRARFLSDPDDDIASAILLNPDWPVDEQRTVARHASGSVLVRWLAATPPGTELDVDDVIADRAADAGRLDADPHICLAALVRHPRLLDLPWDHAGNGMLSAIATITDDERTHYRLLGRAQRLAARGRSSDAARIIEAVALNPTATLAVQRRCRRLARRIRCHYLRHWTPHPALSTAGPTWDDGDEQYLLSHLRAYVDARHCTVWTAIHAVRHRLLSDHARHQLIGYFVAHQRPAGVFPETAHLVARWLDASPQDTERLIATAHTGPRPRPELSPPALGAGLPEVPVTLEHCTGPATVPPAVIALRQVAGTSAVRWQLTFVLLIDGWDDALQDLAPVLDALQPTQELAA